MIAPWHTHYPGLLAGSVYAAPPQRRTEFAGELIDAGLGVHLDVMAEGEGLPAGVSLGHCQEISELLDPSRLDVHLIGSAEFVDDALPVLLDLRPARVFLPWPAFTAGRAADIRAADSSAWIALWQEWPDGRRGQTPTWPAPPDGVLVMLIEPGTSARCEPARLEIAASCASRLPVIVDGGVTEDLAPLCVNAGVEAMVVGRALLDEPRGTEKGI